VLHRKDNTFSLFGKFRHAGNQYASDAEHGNVDERPPNDNDFRFVADSELHVIAEGVLEQHDGEHEDGEHAEEAEDAEDAEGDPEAARERDHTANVHEGGDSLVQEGQHHH